MKILLVSTNRDRWLATPPIGLAILTPILRKIGHIVQVLDLMYTKDPKGDLEKFITEFYPEVVGFSIRNLDNQDMLNSQSYLEEIKQFVGIAKESNVTTVLGGMAFTTLPSELMEYMDADYGIVGQGERSFSLFAESFARGKDLSEIPGLVWRDGDNTKINKQFSYGYAKTTVDWEAINLKKYKHSLLIPHVPIIVNSGCPYRCSFCNNQSIMGEKLFMRDIEAIIDDIKTLKYDYHIHNYFFVVTTFATRMDYIKELLERIINENLKIGFFTNIDPVSNCYDKELFELIVKAGGYFALMSADSFSETMIQNYQKPYTLDDIDNCSRLAKQSGLKFGVELLFGGYGETNDTVKETMRFVPRINFSVFLHKIGVRILPNTQIYNLACQEGLIRDQKALLFPKFYVSRELDVKWAQKYIKNAVNKYNYRYSSLITILGRILRA